MSKHLTKPQLREKANALLVQELGIDGYIEYLQDMGLNSGNYTEERKAWLDKLTPQQILQELKEIKPNTTP